MNHAAVRFAALAGLWLGGHSSTAHAYVAPGSFAESVMYGGGGTRYFTGSHADGYTCQVCHGGGPNPQISLGGLPEDGYDPGQLYYITVDWPDVLPAIALNLEMTDAAGQRFGDLQPISPALLTPADLCSYAPPADLVEAVDLSDGRRILTMAKCGQRQVTVAWQAPLQAGTGWFSGSVVSADRKKDVDGDGVANFTHVFGARGAPAPLASDLVSSCGVMRVDSSSSSPLRGWLLILGTLLLVRRRSLH